MKIADREGRLTRWEDLLDELTPRQIMVLMAYYELHPWGEELEDRRVSVMTAAICSAFSMNGKTIDPADILKLLKPKATPTKAQTISPEAAAARFRTQYRTT